MSLLLVLFHATMRKLSMGNECHSVYGLSVCPSLLVYLFIVCLSVCHSACLSICHSACLSVYCLFVCHSACLSVYCLSVCLSVYLSLSLSVCLLSVRHSACLSVCLLSICHSDSPSVYCLSVYCQPDNTDSSHRVLGEWTREKGLIFYTTNRGPNQTAKFLQWDLIGYQNN